MSCFKYVIAFLAGALAVYFALSFISGSLIWVLVRISELREYYQFFVHIIGKVLVLAGGYSACVIYHFEVKK